jgi:hypothetical protein
MKEVIAEQRNSFVCNCPSCDEMIFSNNTKDWDEIEFHYNDIQIECEGCKEIFIVKKE